MTVRCRHKGVMFWAFYAHVRARFVPQPLLAILLQTFIMVKTPVHPVEWIKFRNVMPLLPRLRRFAHFLRAVVSNSSCSGTMVAVDAIIHLHLCSPR